LRGMRLRRAPEKLRRWLRVFSYGYGCYIVMTDGVLHLPPHSVARFETFRLIKSII
jgi:hypothetical protein